MSAELILDAVSAVASSLVAVIVGVNVIPDWRQRRRIRADNRQPIRPAPQPPRRQRRAAERAARVSLRKDS